MSWKDRVKKIIKLTSPDGDVFEAKWIGDDKSKDKNLGIFNFPDYNGSIIQDLGRKGISYPLAIYFDGADNDIESERFFSSCDQRGPWEIVHPVIGNLTLQLVSVRLRLLPVSSGNITECRTQWIEVLEDNQGSSTTQLAGEINQQALNTNETVSEEFENNESQETAAEKNAIEKSITDLANITRDHAESIINNNGPIFSDFGATYRGIQDTIDQDPIDFKTLAGQVQNLVQVITLAYNHNTEAIVNMYNDMVEGYYTVLTEGSKIIDKNIVNSVQTFISSLIVADCQTATIAELETRPEAIMYSESLTEIFCNSVAELDSIQNNFNDNDIDLQYFSNSLSYNDLLIIVGQSIKYLLESALSLKIEKRFTLTIPKTPLQITIEEYGSLGENDSNLDYFIKTNMLKGNEIRLLQPGKEVVVYA